MTERKKKCPICKAQLPEEATWFPFCSERCKMKDLGAWATGSYAIAGETADIIEPVRKGEDSEESSN